MSVEWTMWMLLSPVAFLLIGSVLIGVGIVLKRGGSAAARFVFAAGAGGYVGSISCLLAWTMEAEDGRQFIVNSLFALTLLWMTGCLVMAAGRRARTPQHPPSPVAVPQPVSTR